MQERQHAFFTKYLEQNPNPIRSPAARAIQSMDYRMISQKGYSPNKEPQKVFSLAENSHLKILQKKSVDNSTLLSNNQSK